MQKYINFYRNNIDCAVVIPTLVYEISVKVKGNSHNDIDILGETILSLIEEGEIINIDNLLKLIGIPYKYKKLLECEINELLDNKILELDASDKVVSINNSDNYSLETFYVIYDRMNKIFLDCIISGKEFKKIYPKNFDFNSNKSCFLGTESKKYTPEKYKLCYQLQQLINRSNKITISEGDYYEKNQEEDYNFIKPFYEIYLNTIDNIDNPIEADFLLKVVINSNQDIQYQSPFSNTTNSKYIDSCIKSKVDETKLLKILQIDYFSYLDKCKEKSMPYVFEYRKYDKDKSRISEIEKISLYKEVLLINGDMYKNFSLVTDDINKIVKSLLKECVSKFSKSRVEKKDICINNLTQLEYIKEILIIKSFIHKREKVIYRDREVIKSIGENSIVSYLKCIFISKFLTNDIYDAEVFKIFSEDIKLMNFMNDIWLYRNNTSHNIEKQEYYKSEYDMDNMQKERLIEAISELMNGLIYFVKIIKESY